MVGMLPSGTGGAVHGEGRLVRPGGPLLASCRAQPRHLRWAQRRGVRREVRLAGGPHGPGGTAGGSRPGGAGLMHCAPDGLGGCDAGAHVVRRRERGGRRRERGMTPVVWGGAGGQ